MAYAIDKDLINERAYDGVRVPSYSGFALDSPYYNPDAGTPQHDPEKAAELVEELGGLEFELDLHPDPGGRARSSTSSSSSVRRPA